MTIERQGAERLVRLPWHGALMHPNRTAIVATLVAWGLAAWVPIPVISLLGTLPLIMWLPGAALLRLSRAQRSPLAHADVAIRADVSALLRLSNAERPSMSGADVALTTALSASVTIAVGLGLALMTNQLHRVPASTVLACLTIACSLLAARRSQSISRQPAAPRGARPVLWPARWIAITAATCCILTGLLGYLSWRLYSTPQPSDSYTVLGLDHQHNTTVIVVTNHQTTAMRFRLIVARGDRTIANRTFALKVGGNYRIALPTQDVTNPTGHSTARLMTEPNNKLYRRLVF